MRRLGTETASAGSPKDRPIHGKDRPIDGGVLRCHDAPGAPHRAPFESGSSLGSSVRQALRNDELLHSESSYTGLARAYSPVPSGVVPTSLAAAVEFAIPAAGAPREAIVALDSLGDLLLAIPEASLLEPKVQVSMILEEARDLAGLLTRGSIRERLRRVGVSDERLDALLPAIEALEQAEARWLVARSRDKTPRQAEAEALAYPLRDEMVAACRFNLQGSDVVELLARVTDGEGATDLVQDLRELAAFVREHIQEFEHDSSFDPALCAEEAAELGPVIALDVAVSAEATDRLEMRDRALTHLCEVVDQLRRAGQYAFRGTPAARTYFASGVTLARRRQGSPGALPPIAG